MDRLLDEWDFDRTTQWLRPVDLFLAIRILDLTGGQLEHTAVLEIGVWQGGWLLQLMSAQPQVEGVGVDPYPGAPELREKVLSRADEKGVATRLALVASAAEVCAMSCQRDSHVPFAVTHIDGLHVEQQVERDLAFAATHCPDDGVIIVDDYLHPAYPGIASALYRFLSSRGFALFLVTRNKAYVCPAQDHARWLSAMEQTLSESGLEWMRHGGEHSHSPYVQPPDVMGFPVLLCIDPGNDKRVLAGVRRPIRYAAAQHAQHWIPAGVRELMRPVRKTARRAGAGAWHLTGH